MTQDPHCGCGTTPERVDTARRRLMSGAAVAAAAAVAGTAASAATDEARAAYADPAEPGLPQVDMTIAKGRTALVVTDPQIDFLSKDGVTWGVVGESVTEQGTVDNIERLFIAAKGAGMPVFISPHYYYPHDHRWQFEGTLEKTMHAIGMFDRPHALELEGFEGSGADWLELDIFLTKDGKLVVTHDKTTKRVGDKNLDIAESTYTELKTVDVATDFRRRHQLPRRVTMWNET